MSYFKKSFVNGSRDAAKGNILSLTGSLLYEHMAYSERVAYGALEWFKLTDKHSDMPVVFDNVNTSMVDNISSGNLGAWNNDTVEYGEMSASTTDVFTFYNSTSNINCTVTYWTEGEYIYTFHIYDNGTTHYTSVATNNPDIAITNPSFTFPVVKDFDLRTATNALNDGSDKYIIQPLVAFGMKMPIFLITGANGADVPLFSEIEAQGKSYFVIGSNYCVEM